MDSVDQVVLIIGTILSGTSILCVLICRYRIDELNKVVNSNLSNRHMAMAKQSVEHDRFKKEIVNTLAGMGLRITDCQKLLHGQGKRIDAHLKEERRLAHSVANAHKMIRKLLIDQSRLELMAARIENQAQCPHDYRLYIHNDTPIEHRKRDGDIQYQATCKECHLTRFVGYDELTKQTQALVCAWHETQEPADDDRPVEEREVPV